MGSLLDKNSSAVRKRIENHTFPDEDGDEYEASTFDGLGDYFRRKKIKLQNLDAEIRASAGDTPQIFKGVVAHVMGYTQPPLHVIHKMLVSHGAGFLQYLDSKTMATHIIASNIPPKKAVDYKNYRIVRPQWVTDSIAAGKLLPWSDYRLVDEAGPRQKMIKFDGGKVTSQAKTPQSQSYKEHSRRSFYSQQLQSSAGSSDIPSTRSVRRNDALQFDSPLASKSDLSPGVFGDVERMHIDTPTKGPNEPFVSDSFKTNAGECQPHFKMPAPPVRSESSSGSGGHGAVSRSETPHYRHLQPPSHNDRSVFQRTSEMTSEAHNKMLLSDPKIRQQSSANPNFLKQFYAESRLHHLSTWKAELKTKMQKMANESRSKQQQQKSAPKRIPTSRRYVMHVDFDSFFCAISLRGAPDYVDMPAAVAHGNGTGSEIASCNYPARKFGVKNGMWMKRALELCPDIKVLPYDFPGYEEASKHFYEAILQVGGVVQSVSVDEALVDITASAIAASGSSGAPMEGADTLRAEQQRCDAIATDLRSEIKKRTGCHVSVGIGGNILLAKVALRKAKPAGQYQIKPAEIQSIIDELKVEQLPGVAYSLGGKLEELGVKLVKDLRQVSKERLTSHLGPKTGEKLFEYARGIDRVEVGDQPPRKSVSAEVNWGIRFINQQEAEEFVCNLCRELERRLLNEQVRGTNLTMKIMRRSPDAPLDPTKHLGHGKCDTFNKSTVFGVATHDANVIRKEAVSILRSFKFSPGDLRGLGVQLTKLEPLKQYSSAAPDGSQRRLAFGPPPTMGKNGRSDPIEEPVGDRHSGGPMSGFSSSKRDMKDDPIADDPLTPKKHKLSKSSVHPVLALSKAGEKDTKANTPLNISGTQFIMPSNPDPAVLNELPQDIRSKLLAQGKKQSGAKTDSPFAVMGGGSGTGGGRGIREPSPFSLAQGKPSRSGSAATVPSAMPADIDPEVFASLPEDMKAEVLSSYGIAPTSSLAGRMMTLTHSPKDKAASRTQTRRGTSPSKRGGGIRDMFHKPSQQGQNLLLRKQQSTSPSPLLPPTTGDAHINITAKSTTLSRPSTAGSAAAAARAIPAEGDAEDREIDPPDPEFLAQLPDDEARDEAIYQYEMLFYERDRRKKQSAAAAAAGGGNGPPPILLRSESSRETRSHGHRDALERETESADANTDMDVDPDLDLDPDPSTRTKITFPPMPEKASFSSKPSGGDGQSTEEVKTMLRAWHASTRHNGPHAKDVKVFERYLGRVVKDEKDVEKVVCLARWLDWLVEEGGSGARGGEPEWRCFVQEIKEEVQKAVAERGFPRLKF
ncbi:hypothetical protein MKZ38_003372 [Zalerion maritima]|uniref:DNA repair protein REV1 n=1 Tax=Zalerion maritima TaxID=339359 RepID=A0AAD5RPA4_9PEZI|nr:hypothetical protein MKZ38_003372 [Zalerion maritima]